MRSRTILTTIVLLSLGGLAGAQGTTKSQSKASPTASAAKMAGPTDSAAHANKARRRHRRVTAKPTTDSAAAHMKSASTASGKAHAKKP